MGECVKCGERMRVKAVTTTVYGTHIDVKCATCGAVAIYYADEPVPDKAALERGGGGEAHGECNRERCRGRAAAIATEASFWQISAMTTLRCERCREVRVIATEE